MEYLKVHFIVMKKIKSANKKNLQYKVPHIYFLYLSTKKTEIIMSNGSINPDAMGKDEKDLCTNC